MSSEIEAGHYWYQPPEGEATILKVIRFDGREAWTSLTGHGIKVEDLPGTIYPFRVENIFDGTALFGLMEGVKNLKEWFNKHENRTGPGPDAPPAPMPAWAEDAKEDIMVQKEDLKKCEAEECEVKWFYDWSVRFWKRKRPGSDRQECEFCAEPFRANEMMFYLTLEEDGVKSTHSPCHEECAHKTAMGGFTTKKQEPSMLVDAGKVIDRLVLMQKKEREVMDRDPMRVPERVGRISSLVEVTNFIHDLIVGGQHEQ